MKFTVVGAGYVGLSLATLISQNYNVILYDIDEQKISSINKKKSPIKDREIQDFLINKKLKLFSTSKIEEAYNKTDFVIIATPTNYDYERGTFDTTSVEKSIKQSLTYEPNACIIIKSTVPLGFSEQMRLKFKYKKIFFSPEFLREGNALHDNLFPSRIIVGGNQPELKIFANILAECAEIKNNNIKMLFMESSAAEAVKLFANTYLAMRVSFFNELDSFSQTHKLSTLDIIQGVSSDPRIGNFYNNPSFGYGGYCLPKDTKQLLNNFDDIPNNLIRAIIDSNETRKKFIAETILKKKPSSIGVYKLAMKLGSDNFRESAVLEVVRLIQESNIKVYLFEPKLDSGIENMTLIKDIKKFLSKSDIIIANRMSKDLESVSNKVFTRDLFGEN